MVQTLAGESTGVLASAVPWRQGQQPRAGCGEVEEKV